MFVPQNETPGPVGDSEPASSQVSKILPYDVLCVLERRHIPSDSTFEQQSFICRACGQTNKRQQELGRHYQTMHLPCCVFCPLEGCGWRGERRDEFKEHFQMHQNDDQKPSLPSEEQYQIYNVKMVLGWIKDWQGDDFLPTIQKWALDAVKERALELGRPEWLEDPWGLSAEKQARRERRAASRR